MTQPSREELLARAERAAFIEAHRHLDLTEVSDEWGKPKFMHSHIDAGWRGWCARAEHSRGSAQEPAPKGWQIVPEECTPDMVRAAPWVSNVRFGWMQMLAAAPAYSPVSSTNSNGAEKTEGSQS